MERRLVVLLAVAALLLLIVLGLRGREGGWGRPAPRPERDSAQDPMALPPPDGADGAVAGPIVLPGEPEAEAEPETRIERFTGDLSLGGVVRDETGRALAGVEVSIRAYSVRHDLPARRVEIRTDEVGAFLFAGLHEGTYTLSAHAPLRQGVYRRFIPAGTTDMEIVLRAGAELVVGVALPEGRASEDVPERLQVWLQRAGDSWATIDSDDRATRTVEFTSLAPGRYRVRSRVPGVGSGEIAVVELTGGIRREVVVPLTEGTVLTGRVVDVETGAAVAGARVAAIPDSVATPVLDLIHEDWAYWNGGAFAEADAEGRFRIVGLFPGSWTVGVRAPRHNPTEVGGVALPASGPLVVRMGSGGDLVVRVLDASGEPAPKVDVLVDVEDRGVFEAVTDEAGRCAVEGLPPGDQVVSVSGRGRSLHADVRVEAGREREVVLRFAGGPAVLTGMVLRDGVPEPNRDVWVDAGRETRIVRSDERGRYRVEDLPEGEVEIFVRSRMGGRRRLLTASLTAGENLHDLEIPMGRATILVVDRETGAPVEGAVLRSQRGIWLRTDDRGRAEILEMDGPLTAFVSSERHAAAAVEVAPGDEPVRVELSPGAVLRIGVEDTDGAGILEPEFEVFAGDEEVGGVGFVDLFASALLGVAEFRLAPGEYRVRVTAEGYEPQEIRVRLDPEGTERTVTLVPR